MSDHDPAYVIARIIRDTPGMHTPPGWTCDWGEAGRIVVSAIRTDPALRAALLGAPSSPAPSPVSAAEAYPATYGYPLPATASQERKARYGDAIDTAYIEGGIADAVMALADAEVRAATAAVAHGGHAEGCSLDTGHTGGCVRGERIECHAPTQPATTADHLAALSAWIDTSPANAGRDREAAQWGRISKVSEECGEVIAAFIGVTGQNPRKGAHGCTEDVVEELLDVALTALAAVEHFCGNDGSSLAMFADKVQRVATRAALLGVPSSPPSSPVGVTEPLPATQGPPDPTDAPQERRARWEEMLQDNPPWHAFGDLADDCQGLADAEQAGLKAEVERQDRRVRFLQSMVDSRDASIVVLDETCADWRQAWSQAAAEVERLKAEATWDRLAAETGAERAQRQTAALRVEVWEANAAANLRTTERDEARATIARVKALADEWSVVRASGTHWTGCHLIHPDCFVLAIRALLAGRPEPCGDRECNECNPSVAATPRLADRFVTDGYGRWLLPPMEGPPPDPLTALDAPTEPAPDLEREPDVPTGLGLASGLWVGNAIQVPANVPAHDPPGREPENPLAATKARLEKAMRGMDPT